MYYFKGFIFGNNKGTTVQCRVVFFTVCYNSFLYNFRSMDIISDHSPMAMMVQVGAPVCVRINSDSSVFYMGRVIDKKSQPVAYHVNLDTVSAFLYTQTQTEKTQKQKGNVCTKKTSPKTLILVVRVHCVRKNVMCAQINTNSAFVPSHIFVPSSLLSFFIASILLPSFVLLSFLTSFLLCTDNNDNTMLHFSGKNYELAIICNI